MNEQVLKAAVAEVRLAVTAMPAELDGILAALGDLDELLGELSRYSRGLSISVEGLPGRTNHLRVNELDGQLAPELVCKPAATHLQAAAAGIDQAKSAVTVAHRLVGRLH